MNTKIFCESLVVMTINLFIREVEETIMLGIRTGKTTRTNIRKKSKYILCIISFGIRLIFHRFSSNDAMSMLESPSSSAGSLDQASPRFRSNGDSNDSGNFYVTMTSSKSKAVSVNKSMKICGNFIFHLIMRPSFMFCYS